MARFYEKIPMISMKDGLFVSNQRLYRVIYRKKNIFRRVVRKKMMVGEVNKKKQLSLYLERRRWTVNQHWNQVILSD